MHSIAMLAVVAPDATAHEVVQAVIRCAGLSKMLAVCRHKTHSLVQSWLTYRRQATCIMACNAAAMTRSSIVLADS